MIYKVINNMIEYYAGDPKRVQHFIKVHAFALLIGRGEGLDEHTQYVLEIAAAVHDIGIKISEIKYNSSAGRYQEPEGPEQARALLAPLGIDKADIDRICFLVGHHHTYDSIDGIDYQIPVEADFIVNAYEDKFSQQALENAYNSIFKTDTGRGIFRRLYLQRTMPL